MARRPVRRAWARGADRDRGRSRDLLVAARDRRGGRRARRACRAARAGASPGLRSAPSERRRSPTTSRPASGGCGGCCRAARPTTSSARSGPADAERTVVLVAHHDTAHSGLVFHPALPQHRRARSGLIERHDTSPTLMAPVVGGPAAGGARGCPAAAALASSGSSSAPAPWRRWPTSAVSRRSPRRQRQRRPPSSLLLALAPPLIERAAGGGQGDPALGRVGGVVQRGDEGVRRAPLRRPAQGEHVLPLPSTRSGSPHLQRPARRGLPEDVGVPAARRSA